MKPLLSIITPSLNQGRFIEETILSVLSQEGNFGIEYIIIDGSSTDNSIDIIKKYDRLLKENRFPVTCAGVSYRWVSEPDNGHADAINKGFRLAQGDILAYLNADDLYEPGAFAAAAAFFSTDTENTDVLYGNGFLINEHGHITGLYPSKDINTGNNDLGTRCFICQPALFMRRAVLEKCGYMNSNIQVSIDYEYWLRFAGQGLKFKYIRPVLACSRLYAQTKTSRHRDIIYNEIFALLDIYKKDPAAWECACAKELSCVGRLLHSIIKYVKTCRHSFALRYGKRFVRKRKRHILRTKNSILKR